MRVGIVGLGLIGASAGLAIRRWPKVVEVVGSDGLSSHEEVALLRGAVDRCVTAEDIAQCDLVFVAVPPDAVVPFLMFLESAKKPGLVATDCAGVKVPVAKWASRKRSRRSWVVPGHPLGGTEHTGPAEASEAMFEGRPWLLTPPSGAGKEGIMLVEEAIRAMGAIPVRCDAEEHDAHLALVSHLPHFIAASLILEARQRGLKLPSGGSWKDMIRVSGSNPELWTQLSLANRKEIVRALNSHIAYLLSARKAVKRGDRERIRGFFEAASEAKRSLPSI